MAVATTTTTNQEVPPATIMFRTLVVAPDVWLVEGVVGAWGVGTLPPPLPPDAMDGAMVVGDEALLPPGGMPGVGVGIIVLDGEPPGTMVVKEGGVVTMVPLRPPPPPPPVVELPLPPLSDGQHKDVKPPGVQAVLVAKASKKRLAWGQVKLTKGPDDTTPLTLVTDEHI